MAQHAGDEANESTLKHIYFFIDKNTAIAKEYRLHKSIDDDRAAKADGAHDTAQQHSCTSTSCSSEAGSTIGTSSSSGSDLNPLAASFDPGSSHPAASSTTGLFELRKTSDKGLGLFAKYFIKRGTLIILEQPLMKTSNTAIYQAWNSYCQLGNTQKATYDSLHAFKPEGLDLEQASRLYLIDPEDDTLDEDDVEGLVAEQVKVMSIFSVNNFAFPPTGLAVYASGSRLNHSCVPNVHHCYNPNLNSLTVHAITDIQPGEELMTSYLGGPGTYMTRTQRIERLRSAYGFTCQCPSCFDRTGTSDQRRELMRCIGVGLEQYQKGQQPTNAFIPGNDAAALKQAQDLVQCMAAEGIWTIEMTKAIRFTSQFALKLKRFDIALNHAAHEHEVEKACLGTAVADLERSGVATSVWISHIFDVIKAEQGEEAVKAHRVTWHKEKKASGWKYKGTGGKKSGGSETAKKKTKKKRDGNATLDVGQ